MSFKASILWSVQYCIISPQDDELSMNWIKAALPSSPLQRVCHGPNKTLELHEYNNLWRLSSLNSIIPECTFAAPHTMKPSLVKHWMDPGGLVLRRRRLLELWCGCDYTAESMGRTDREQSGSFPVCANVISTACTVDAVLIRRAGRCGRSFLQCSRSFKQYKREDRELLRHSAPQSQGSSERLPADCSAQKHIHALLRVELHLIFYFPCPTVSISIASVRLIFRAWSR